MVSVISDQDSVTYHRARREKLNQKIEQGHRALKNDLVITTEKDANVLPFREELLRMI